MSNKLQRHNNNVFEQGKENVNASYSATPYRTTVNDDPAIAAGDQAAGVVEPGDRGVHRRGDRAQPAARIERGR